MEYLRELPFYLLDLQTFTQWENYYDTLDFELSAEIA